MQSSISPQPHDVVLVGGGIVGLATALRILEARPGTRLLLAEKEDAVGQHQTSHNSGVIHAGLYYKPGSAKATLCRRGYAQLVDFCRREGIPYEICGKVVVATHESELSRLNDLFERGQANGLTQLRRLGPKDITEIEPHCAGIAGIFVPESGIVDYAVVARRYADLIRERGGEIALRHQVDEVHRSGNLVHVSAGAARWTARVLISCAGLQSDVLARQTQRDLSVRIIPFRGEYYVLRPEARHLVRNLIYPVPDPAFPFLGVHFTRGIGGEVECGPNAVFAFAREGYRKTDFRLRDVIDAVTWPGFRTVARKYWRTGLGEYRRSFSKRALARGLQRLIPDIRSEDLVPGGAGVRAQACSRDGKLLDDFHVVHDENVIHVCNAPSPAATASLAIGESLAQSAVARLS